MALRRERQTIRAIATQLERPVSTVRRWLASQGMSRLPPIDPPPPVQRYEHAAPGDPLDLDIKKLGCIVRPGHRVTGNPRDSVNGAGWECVHVAIDDHSRVGFSHSYSDETAVSAVAFLRAAVAYYAALGVTIQRLLTDNGSAYRSKAFAAECHHLGIKHRFTRPYTPRTNGKAERFIQTALREWAYATTYSTSADRQVALQPWMHRYNHHRPYSALCYLPPFSRIPRNNVSNLNTADAPLSRVLQAEGPVLAFARRSIRGMPRKITPCTSCRRYPAERGLARARRCRILLGGPQRPVRGYGHAVADAARRR